MVAMNDPGGPELLDSKNPGPNVPVSDYGNLILSPRVLVIDDFDVAFSSFPNRLKDFVRKVPQGDLDVLVHVNLEFASQCNFELSTALISALKDLRATFTLSCY